MIEPEVAFADIHDNMTLAEDFVKYLISFLMENCREDLELFFNFVDKGLEEKLNHVLASDFARIEYREAIKILEASGEKFEYPVGFGVDMQTEHERYLAEKHFKKLYLFITILRRLSLFICVRTMTERRLQLWICCCLMSASLLAAVSVKTGWKFWRLPSKDGGAGYGRVLVVCGAEKIRLCPALRLWTWV